MGCCDDEHFLYGTLSIRVVERASGRPAEGVVLVIGVTEDEAIRATCKARRVVTGADGQCEVEFPIGKAVVATGPKNFEVAWVALDRETDVVLEV